jgi:hypothetical protein
LNILLLLEAVAVDTVVRVMAVVVVVVDLEQVVLRLPVQHTQLQ